MFGLIVNVSTFDDIVGLSKKDLHIFPWNQASISNGLRDIQRRM